MTTIRWMPRPDANRLKDRLRCERKRQSEPPLTAAEDGPRHRFLCGACTRRWRSTVRATQCPFCKKAKVEEVA